MNKLISLGLACAFAAGMPAVAFSAGNTTDQDTQRSAPMQDVPSLDQDRVPPVDRQSPPDSTDGAIDTQSEQRKEIMDKRNSSGGTALPGDNKGDGGGDDSEDGDSMP